VVGTRQASHHGCDSPAEDVGGEWKGDTRHPIFGVAKLLSASAVRFASGTELITEMCADGALGLAAVLTKSWASRQSEARGASAGSALRAEIIGGADDRLPKMPDPYTRFV